MKIVFVFLYNPKFFPRFPMFPCYEHKLRWDDYGEIIRAEDWAEIKAEDVKVTFLTNILYNKLKLLKKQLLALRSTCVYNFFLSFLQAKTICFDTYRMIC